MSTYTHINQDPVFNATLGTTVPPRWENLVSVNLPTIQDDSLSGISRTIYAAPRASSAIHGEVWTRYKKAIKKEGDEKGGEEECDEKRAEKEAVDRDAPSKTFRVQCGGVQMYVLSGAGSITKNGSTIQLREGEKVSLATGDTFSFRENREMRILVRNEGATFAEGTYTPEVAKLRPPTDEEVQRLRAELGVTTVPTARASFSRRTHEPASSSGYARSKVG